MLELLRTAGMWHASVRYGYVYGALASEGNLVAGASLWPVETLASVTTAFESTWSAIVAEAAVTKRCGWQMLRSKMENRMHEQLSAIAKAGT